MLPPITSTPGKLRLTQRTRSSTPSLWPCAVSTTSASTPALTSSSTRSSVPSPTPTAAPTRSLPCASRAALGKLVCLVMSLTVIRPRSSKASLTTSTRSSLCACISALPSARVAPSRTLISLSRGVMMSLTGASRRVSKRTSRLVTMPTTVLPCSTGKPGHAVLLRQLDDLAHRLVGRHGDRVAQHARLVALDARDLGRLLARRHVLVNDADAAFLRQRDREARFGDGVHRRRDERDVQSDVAGEGGRQAGVAGQDLGRRQGPATHRRRSALCREGAWGMLQTQKRIIRMQRQTNDSGPPSRRRPKARRYTLWHLSPRLKSMARWTLAMVAALVGAALALPVQAQTQWKWRDKTGRTQYSDLPPPATVPEQDILSRPAAVTRRAAAAASAPPAPFMAGSAPLPPLAAASLAHSRRSRRSGTRSETEEGRGRSGREGQGRGSQGRIRQGRELRPRPGALADARQRRPHRPRQRQRRARNPRRQAARRRDQAHPRHHRRGLQVAPCCRRCAAPPRLLRIDLQRPVDLDPIALLQRRVERAEPAPDADRLPREIDVRMALEHAAGTQRVDQRRTGAAARSGTLRPGRPRDCRPPPPTASPPRQRAPYTCSARFTNASTNVLAIRSKTGLISASSAPFENA